MKRRFNRILTIALMLGVLFSLSAEAFAAVSYMPDVTPEMSDADFWASRSGDPDAVMMTREEIRAQNADTALASGTSVMDLKTAAETFDGIARNKAIKSSATADAEYYFGWTYGPDGKKADWKYYQKMIDNCADPNARKEQKTRYGICVTRTVLKTFPSDNPIWDDPADSDFDYQALSGIRVNEPILIYTTSKDGKYYLARISCCSGWVRASDVAVCKDREEWLGAWDIADDEVLVVTGNKIYTDTSNTHPEVSKRMLSLGTKLRSVDPATVTGLVNNRSPYHNYIVELPVRAKDGSYQKSLALIPETADISEGYLPLTQRNVVKIAMANLGDAYGWGGMMDVEDCSGLVRLIYECFGLDIARNGNWQWCMNVAKIDMENMSTEEKCRILDKLPLGAALSFSGHEMMYLGKVDGKYYVYSTASKIVDPADDTKILRTRGVMINTLDVKRANGHTWMQDLYRAFVLGYGDASERDYEMPQYAWYHEGVKFCLKNSIMSSGKGGYFGVNDAVTRADTALALWTLAGKPGNGSTEMSFTDVAADDPAAPAIAFLSKLGVMQGYSQETFAPQDTLTREQLCMVIGRFISVQNIYLGAVSLDDLSAYRDRAKVSADAKEAMSWMVGSGLLSGSTGNRLAPRDAVTRAQLATVLLRYDQLKTAAAEASKPAEIELPETVEVTPEN